MTAHTRRTSDHAGQNSPVVVSFVAELSREQALSESMTSWPRCCKAGVSSQSIRSLRFEHEPACAGLFVQKPKTCLRPLLTSLRQLAATGLAGRSELARTVFPAEPAQMQLPLSGTGPGQSRPEPAPDDDRAFARAFEYV